MEEKRHIECPECKSAIREDVKKCPNCRSRVNKPYRGAMSDKTGKGLFLIIFIALLAISEWAIPYIEDIFGTKIGRNEVPYIFGFAFVIVIIFFIVLEVKVKRKHDKLNQKVYVDSPKEETA